MKYVVSVEEMRALEQNAIRKIGISEEVLMERAACAVWGELSGKAGPKDSILFLCGTGNNGGDGLASARMAYLAGLHVSVAIVSKEDVRVFELRGEADAEAAKKEYLPARCSAGFAGQFAILSKIAKFAGKDWNLAEYTIVVDAVFGIGLSRPVAGTYREYLQRVQEEKLKRKLFIISVDIPSGIHADTGAVMGIAVEADLTVTFGWEKTGLLLYPGAHHAGKVVTADIGIPPEASILGAETGGVTVLSILRGKSGLTSEASVSRADIGSLSETSVPLVDSGISSESGGVMPHTVLRMEPSDIRALPKRNPDTHKGDYGKVTVIAGSDGMCGAAILAAKAAYRAGAGIVTVVSAKENRLPIQTALPEAIFAPRSRAEEMIARADCLAIGPGLGTDEEAVALVRLALTSGKPAVADADALNCISKSREEKKSGEKMADHLLCSESADSGEAGDLYGLLHHQAIVTPHVGEMARLTGLSSVEVRENPLKTAREFAEKYGCICVLKGARTIVSDGAGFTCINTSGNAGMAVGGSGDVLTGVIAGLLATERDVRTAAALGVYAHGLAGDHAKVKLGERSMGATDILEGLSSVLQG